jgi:hypothetical protein
MDRGTRGENRPPMPLSPKDLACGIARELRTDRNRFRTEPPVRREQKQRKIQLGSGRCGETVDSSRSGETDKTDLCRSPISTCWMRPVVLTLAVTEPVKRTAIRKHFANVCHELCFVEVARLVRDWRDTCLQWFCRLLFSGPLRLFIAHF